MRNSLAQFGFPMGTPSASVTNLESDPAQRLSIRSDRSKSRMRTVFFDEVPEGIDVPRTKKRRSHLKPMCQHGADGVPTDAAARFYIAFLMGISRSVANAEQLILQRPECLKGHRGCSKLPTEDFDQIDSHLYVDRPEKDRPIMMKVKSYAPIVFTHLALWFGFTVREMIEEWNIPASRLTTIRSAGRSGALFLASLNRRFLMKTISKTEAECMRKKLLRSYYQHFFDSQESFLCRILGLYKFTVDPNSSFSWMENVFAPHETVVDVWYVVVMENVVQVPSFLNSKPAMYDLKGREIKKNHHFRHRNFAPENYVYKDNDLERQFFFGLQVQSSLIKCLHRDIDWLCEHNLMDYSLLIGVVNIPVEDVFSSYGGATLRCRASCEVPSVFSRVGTIPIESPKFHIAYSALRTVCGGIPSCRVSDSDQMEVYYIGLIDVFTAYGIKKQLANLCKSFRFKASTLSTIPPEPYCNRLKKYLCSILVATSSSPQCSPISTPTNRSDSHAIPAPTPSEVADPQLVPDEDVLSLHDRGLGSEIDENKSSNSKVEGKPSSVCSNPDYESKRGKETMLFVDESSTSIPVRNDISSSNIKSSFSLEGFSYSSDVLRDGGPASVLTTPRQRRFASGNSDSQTRSSATLTSSQAYVTVDVLPHVITSGVANVADLESVHSVVSAPSLHKNVLVNKQTPSPSPPHMMPHVNPPPRSLESSSGFSAVKYPKSSTDSVDAIFLWERSIDLPEITTPPPPPRLLGYTVAGVADRVAAARNRVVPVQVTGSLEHLRDPVDRSHTSALDVSSETHDSDANSAMAVADSLAVGVITESYGTNAIVVDTSRRLPDTFDHGVDDFYPNEYNVLEVPPSPGAIPSTSMVSFAAFDHTDSREDPIPPDVYSLSAKGAARLWLPPPSSGCIPASVVLFDPLNVEDASCIKPRQSAQWLVFAVQLPHAVQTTPQQRHCAVGGSSTFPFTAAVFDALPDNIHASWSCTRRFAASLEESLKCSHAIFVPVISRLAEPPGEFFAVSPSRQPVGAASANPVLEQFRQYRGCFVPTAFCMFLVAKEVLLSMGHCSTSSTAPLMLGSARSLALAVGDITRAAALKTLRPPAAGGYYYSPIRGPR